MRQIMWWTYGMSGKDCKKIFPDLTSSVEDYNNIVYIRKNDTGGYTFRFAEGDEEYEYKYFKDKIRLLNAEEKDIEELVGVL